MSMTPLAQPIRPAKLWYVISFGLLVLSIASAVAAWQSFAGLFDNIERVLIPGSGTVQLEEPGTYTIMQETRSVFEGRAFSVPAASVPSALIEVNQAADGTQIPVTPSSSAVDYSFPSYAGSSIAEFTIGEPGNYTVTGNFEGGDGPEIILAITKDPGSRILGGIGKVALAGFLGFVALVIALITFIRRITSKRRSQAPAFAQH